MNFHFRGKEKPTTTEPLCLMKMIQKDAQAFGFSTIPHQRKTPQKWDAEEARNLKVNE